MIAVAEPIQPARGRRVRLPWVPFTIVFLSIILLVGAGVAMPWGRVAQGVEKESGVQLPAPGTLLTYDDSVRISIQRSPYLAKSSLNINIRKMDESDSRYGMVPPLTFTTIYYVNRPNDPNLSPEPYSLSFSTEPYNPVGAYFTLQAQKLATKAAVLTHLKVISKALESLGKFYLELAAIKKMNMYQQDLIKANQEALTYMENRLNIGTATTLDVKLAQQELQLAKGEQESMAMAQKRNLNSLRAFLGLPPNQQVDPDLRDVEHQVLGNFKPATADLERAKTLSAELKMLEIERQLQQYNVYLAIAKVFPNVLFNTQTPDPLSATTGRGLFVGFGLQIPVWDGFKRIRNVSRQKVVLKQLEAQKGDREFVLEDKWHDAIGIIQSTDVALKLAKSREELARLRSQQTEVRYQSGEVTLPSVLESRKEVLTAQKEVARKSMEHYKGILTLREISGDLENTYVRASSFEK